MSEFTVYAFDINTNTLITELPANGLTFDCRLNDAGAIAFDCNLSSPKASPRVQRILPYLDGGIPFALYVDRDGTIVWAGWCDTDTYMQSAGDTLSIGGKEWLDVFTMRTVVAPYTQVQFPSGIDPAQLIWLAVTDAQNPAKAGPGASLGINVVGGSSNLPLTVPSYPVEQYPFVSQVIADQVAGLTPGTGGVDVSITAAWSSSGRGSSPIVTMQVLSPRAGRVAGQTGLLFDTSTSMDYSWPGDRTQGCTTLIATGGGSGQTAPVAVVQAPGIPVGGLGQFCRIDKVVQHSNVADQGLLTSIATGEAGRYGGAVVTPTVRISTSDVHNPLGSWVVGDDARFRNPGDYRHPGGFDQFWRIVQHSVNVPDEGVADVTLTLNPPPVF